MPSYLLQETADRLLQENGYRILLEDSSAQYLWLSGVSYSDRMRMESFSFTEAANMGEVGVGGLNVDDDDLTASVGALGSGLFNDYRASSARVWTGFVHSRTTQQGPNKVAGQREWDVEVVDLNTLADDYVFTTSDADRPAETDYARVTWLLTNTISPLAQTGLVSAGVVPNTNTITMDAIDYRGRKPREVLDQCAEITGKNWFIYQHSNTTGALLYYDLQTGTSLGTTSKISDVASDVDNSTVWAPIGPPTVVRTPDEIYSTVRLTWSGGVVTVTNATTASTYRAREIALLDMGCRTSTTATAKANAFLAASAAERTVVSDISLRLPAANVNDFRAGQRAQIKLTRHGISSYTYYRITRRTVRALPGNSGVTDAEYLVTLSLVDTLAPTRYLYQRGSNEVWEVKSNATQDGASVIVNRSGITVTSGAITVTNPTGTVIIDGTSNMYKIAASGTDTYTSGTAPPLDSGGTTTTYSGTGLPNQTPAFLAWVTEGTSPATNANRDLGGQHHNGALYGSGTSGGATNVYRTVQLWLSSVYGTTSASLPATVTGMTNADSSTHSMYARIHLLKESAI